MGRSKEEVHHILANWQDRKLFELQFVQVAGTLLSGAAIGCFSWNVRDEEHWLGPASWYCCLVLSLFAILSSSTEAFIFSSMKSSLRPVSFQSRLSMICHTENYPREVGSFASTNDSEKGKSADPPPVRCHIRWNMVFTWQAPIMLLSYGVIAFLVGISVYIITPLYTNDQSLGGKPVSHNPQRSISTRTRVLFIWSHGLTFVLRIVHIFKHRNALDRSICVIQISKGLDHDWGLYVYRTTLRTKKLGNDIRSTSTTLSLQIYKIIAGGRTQLYLQRSSLTYHETRDIFVRWIVTSGAEDDGRIDHGMYDWYFLYVDRDILEKFRRIDDAWKEEPLDYDAEEVPVIIVKARSLGFPNSPISTPKRLDNCLQKDIGLIDGSLGGINPSMVHQSEVSAVPLIHPPHGVMRTRKVDVSEVS
ncbi:hypothetical protein CHU98_g4400 [Xylaria longipes]|nr:hypothetical protein CHU98_g4400 [Xylaria longipes]